MDPLVDLTEWMRQERQRAKKQLAALEAERFKVAEDRGHGWVDQTHEMIEHLRHHIDELSELLERYDADKSRDDVG